MGAVTVLPYYGLTDPKKNKSKIDSANFMTKAKAALTYYERTVKSDLLYYVGETTLQAFHENNEKTQPDEANFTELVAATALFDFLQRSRPQQRQYLTRAIEMMLHLWIWLLLVVDMLLWLSVLQTTVY